MVDTCLDYACEATATQSGCVVDIDPGACSEESLVAEANPEGVLDYARSDTFGRCSPESPPSGALASARCQGGGFDLQDCVIDLYPQADEPSFEVERIVFSPSPAVGNDPPFGVRHLGSLIPTANGVAVSRFESPTNGDCVDQPTVLEMIDATTLEVRSATAPPCLLEMASLPEGSFVGVHTSSTGFAISRFDDDASVVETVELTVDNQNRVVDLAVNEESAAILFWTEDRPNTVVLVDLPSLDNERPIELASAEGAVSVTGFGDAFAFADAITDAMYVLQSGAVQVIPLKDVCGKGSPWFVTVSPQSGEFLMSVRGNDTQRVLSLNMTDCGGDLLLRRVSESRT